MENKKITRAEYKEKYLQVKHLKKRGAIMVSKETKIKLKQLCSAADNKRVPMGCLIENIISDHLQRNSEVIEELYKYDIPIW